MTFRAGAPRVAVDGAGIVVSVTDVSRGTTDSVLVSNYDWTVGNADRSYYALQIAERFPHIPLDDLPGFVRAIVDALKLGRGLFTCKDVLES